MLSIRTVVRFGFIRAMKHAIVGCLSLVHARGSIMPYTKSPRPWKHEYQMQKRRGEHEDRMERQKARRALDKKGVDRAGKDVSHKKPLRNGGTNKDGYALQSPSKNRSNNGKKKLK